jgi:cyclin-dependent kinase
VNGSRQEITHSCVSYVQPPQPDLKPANLLLSRTGQLKVADFGLARVCAPSPHRRLTQEVVTLWYRAPEILLGSRQYGFAADLWSVGLIFVEMITKSPLFRTKRLAEIEVLFQIFHFAGTPTEATWPTVTKLPNWSSEFPKWRRRPVEPFLRQNMDERGLELLYRFLTMDPTKRITAKAALNHAYFL